MVLAVVPATGQSERKGAGWAEENLTAGEDVMQESDDSRMVEWSRSVRDGPGETEGSPKVIPVEAPQVVEEKGLGAGGSTVSKDDSMSLALPGVGY